jgi:hypothetical protein
MNVMIKSVRSTYSQENGYVGTIELEVEGHQSMYEVTLHSKDAKNWSYSLHFTKQSGMEEEIVALEERIEEDDDLFDSLVDAVMKQVTI